MQSNIKSGLKTEQALTLTKFHPPTDGPPADQWRQAAAARVDAGAAVGLRRDLRRGEYRPHHHRAQQQRQGAQREPSMDFFWY